LGGASAFTSSSEESFGVASADVVVVIDVGIKGGC